jgi:hypothetical protein
MNNRTDRKTSPGQFRNNYFTADRTAQPGIESKKV